MAFPREDALSARPFSIPEFAGDVSGGRIAGNPFFHFASTDFEAVTDRLCRLFKPHDIKPRSGWREERLFELDEMAVGTDLVLAKISYNRDVTIEAPPLDDFFVLQFTLTGACQTSQGQLSTIVDPGKLCVLNVSRPIRQDMDGAYSQMAVKISRSVLERQLAADLGHGLPRLLEFSAEAQPLSGSLASLARILSTIWSDMGSGVSAYHQPTVQRSTQQMIASLLLSAFPHNFSDQFHRNGEIPAPYFVRRAERYIQDNAQNAITLADIVAASSVSQRTLQTGFRHFRDTTPMAYLKSVRLELARQALMMSGKDAKTVTDVAFDCGFTHLSKFAQDYKARYGETPSATARVGTI